MSFNRGLARWGLSFAVAGLLSAGAAPAWADVEQVRKDVEALFAPVAGEEQVFQHGTIDVTQQGDAYNVTVNALRIGDATEGSLEVGTVTAVLTPEGDDQYRITDLKLPAKMTPTDESGQPDGEITIGSQQFSGLFSKSLHTFLDLDAAYRDIAAKDAAGTVDIKVGGVVANADSTEASPGKWDQRGTARIENFVVQNKDEPSVKLDSFEVSSGLRGLRIAEFRALMERLETLAAQMQPTATMDVTTDTGTTGTTDGSTAAGTTDSGTAATTDSGTAATTDTATTGTTDAGTTDAGTTEAGTAGTTDAAATGGAPTPGALPQDMIQALRDAGLLLGDTNVSFAMKGLLVTAPDNSELFRMDDAGFGFGVTGLDQERSGAEFSAFLNGVAVPHPEMAGVPPEFAAQVTPKEASIRLTLESIPARAIWNAFIDGVVSGDMANSDAQQVALGIFGATSQQLVLQAGSKLRIADTRLVLPASRVDVDGMLEASPASPMGAVGTVNIAIAGLDAMVELATKAAPDAQQAQNMGAFFDLLRAFSDRQTAADGTVVDRYAFAITDTGALLLNGKDFSAFLSGMQ